GGVVQDVSRLSSIEAGLQIDEQPFVELLDLGVVDPADRAAAAGSVPYGAAVEGRIGVPWAHRQPVQIYFDAEVDADLADRVAEILERAAFIAAGVADHDHAAAT